jgi:hypothetical protein
MNEKADRGYQMIRQFRMAGAGTLFVLVAGCAQAPLGIPQQVGPQDTQLAMNSVNVIDRVMLEKKRTDAHGVYDYGKIRIESSGGARSATGTLEAWTTIQNLTDHPQTVQLRTRFFDAAKRPVEDYSAWQRVSLPPKGTGLYKEFSLGTAAAFYYIELKGAE